MLGKIEEMKRSYFFYILFVSMIGLSSCDKTTEDNQPFLKSFDSDTITKKDLKDYFDSKGIKITFEKPKSIYSNKLLKPLVFKSIQELDTYLNVTHENYQTESIYDALTHHDPDDLGGGGDSESPSFFRRKVKIGGITAYNTENASLSGTHNCRK